MNGRRKPLGLQANDGTTVTVLEGAAAAAVAAALAIGVEDEEVNATRVGCFATPITAQKSAKP